MACLESQAVLNPEYPMEDTRSVTTNSKIL